MSDEPPTKRTDRIIWHDEPLSSSLPVAYRIAAPDPTPQPSDDEQTT